MCWASQPARREPIFIHEEVARWTGRHSPIYIHQSECEGGKDGHSDGTDGHERRVGVVRGRVLPIEIEELLEASFAINLARGVYYSFKVVSNNAGFVTFSLGVFASSPLCGAGRSFEVTFVDFQEFLAQIHP